MALARNQIRVLGFLTEAKVELPGIEVADEIGGLARSSAYAALAALQRDGLVSARWDTSGSHPQRMFKITAEGARAFVEARQELVQPSFRTSLQGA